jgi:hypothetical protein
MMRIKVGLCALGVFALAGVAGCSTYSKGNGGTADPTVSISEGASAEASQQIVVSDDPSGFTPTSEQEICMGAKVILAFGVDRLDAMGITPEGASDDSTDLTALGMTVEEAGALYDTYGQCGIDMKAQMIQGFNENMSDEDARCVYENFDDNVAKLMLVVGMTQGEDAVASNQGLMEKVLELFSKCPGAFPTDA